eukprot:COSAG06_NODE_90_length_24779_cov_33.515843_22_plen_47_part_00
MHQKLQEMKKKKKRKVHEKNGQCDSDLLNTSSQRFSAQFCGTYLAS